MRGNVARVSSHVFKDDGRFPNSRLPLIHYRGAVVEEEVTAEAFEQMFSANGWVPQWRDTVLERHHYHSTAHEVLGVAAGRAVLAFGGPGGRMLEVAAGDAVAIPAGVAHKLEEASADFLVVGAYPPGQDWDMRYGEAGERPGADEAIAAVPAPATDPVSGAGGPLLKAWG